ncbi:hypothetical protein MIR68_004215 [Amoeboaphelidium protococcarum]|nr:hypothetical protein MIR68_004215 [Amoeboaphelidium protococcarum]
MTEEQIQTAVSVSAAPSTRIDESRRAGDDDLKLNGVKLSAQQMVAQSRQETSPTDKRSSSLRGNSAGNMMAGNVAVISTHIPTSTNAQALGYNVDYFSHEWNEPDLKSSWSLVTRLKNVHKHTIDAKDADEALNSSGGGGSTSTSSSTTTNTATTTKQRSIRRSNSASRRNKSRPRSTSQGDQAATIMLMSQKQVRSNDDDDIVPRRTASPPLNSYKKYAEGIRLENATWRKWLQTKYRLGKIRPDSEFVRWKKDEDITWLYGPLIRQVEGNGSHEYHAGDAQSNHHRRSSTSQVLMCGQVSSQPPITTKPQQENVVNSVMSDSFSQSDSDQVETRITPTIQFVDPLKDVQIQQRQFGHSQQHTTGSFSSSSTSAVKKSALKKGSYKTIIEDLKRFKLDSDIKLAQKFPSTSTQLLTTSSASGHTIDEVKMKQLQIVLPQDDKSVSFSDRTTVQEVDQMDNIQQNQLTFPQAVVKNKLRFSSEVEVVEFDDYARTAPSMRGHQSEDYFVLNHDTPVSGKNAIDGHRNSVGSNNSSSSSNISHGYQTYQNSTKATVGGAPQTPQERRRVQQQQQQQEPSFMSSLFSAATWAATFLLGENSRQP